MISDPHSEVPIFIKLLAIRTPKSRSETCLRIPLLSPDLNQMISDLRSKVLIWIKYFAIYNPIGAHRNSE